MKDLEVLNGWLVSKLKEMGNKSKEYVEKVREKNKAIANENKSKLNQLNQDVRSNISSVQVTAKQSSIF